MFEVHMPARIGKVVDLIASFYPGWLALQRFLRRLEVVGVDLRRNNVVIGTEVGIRRCGLLDRSRSVALAVDQVNADAGEHEEYSKDDGDFSCHGDLIWMQSGLRAAR